MTKGWESLQRGRKRRRTRGRGYSDEGGGTERLGGVTEARGGDCKACWSWKGLKPSISSYRLYNLAKRFG